MPSTSRYLIKTEGKTRVNDKYLIKTNHPGKIYADGVQTPCTDMGPRCKKSKSPKIGRAHV